LSTAQKVQLRVQVFPRIMKVAVPRRKQSAWLGQCAELQTVCKPCVLTTPSILLLAADPEVRMRNHPGRRVCGFMILSKSVFP
jgi:hypothetical protein